MAEYNNSAGRILSVFDRLAPNPNTPLNRPHLAKGFGVIEEWPSIFVAYCDLRDEYNTLAEEIEKISDNELKRKLFRENLPDIESSLKSFVFTVSADQGHCNISRTGLVALRFIAADLPQDEDATKDDLNTIRQIVSELQKEIENATDFSKQMREWLLDLVRVIRDSLDRYANRGSRGMRKQFSLLVGELMQNYEYTQETQDKAPVIWTKITTAIDLMHKIASLAEKCRPAILFTQKLLPFVKTLGLPGPTDPNP
jgi:hypothetical protein